MIAFRVGYSHGAGAQGSGSFGQGGGGGEGCTGDLECNPRRERQGAANRNQRSARGDVQCGCKLEELLPFFVSAADEYRDRQWQTRPHAAFCFRRSWVQASPLVWTYHLLTAPCGPNRVSGSRHFRPKIGFCPGDSPQTRPGSGTGRPIIRLIFALGRNWAALAEMLVTASFFPSGTISLHFSLTVGKVCPNIGKASICTSPFRCSLPSLSNHELSDHGPNAKRGVSVPGTASWSNRRGDACVQDTIGGLPRP